MIRRAVREEVDSALGRHMINRKRNNIHQFQSRNLLLQFSNVISLPMFVGTPIKGEGGITIEVALVDASNGQVVSSGLGSSARVEIVVLPSDFGGDKGENWSPEEFASNIVTAREGKKPLLTGRVILTLINGNGLVDVWFTDNSSWTKSGKFRLGARLVDGIDGIRAREAISEPFTVKSPLRESQMKHRLPSLSHEVWRLKNISKDGKFHTYLRGGGVNTVKDFLILLYSKPERLRHILRKMSSKAWQVTVQHARACVLDRTFYAYDGSTSPRTNGVVLNVVREVMGMFRDGQFVSADKLSDAEKVRARLLVISAFENCDKIVTLDDESSPNVPPSLPPSKTDHQDLSSPNTQQHDASLWDMMESLPPIGSLPSLDDSFHNPDQMDIGHGQPMSFPNQVSDILTNGMPCAIEQLNFSEMNDTTMTDNFNPCPSVAPIRKVRDEENCSWENFVWTISQDDDVAATLSSSPK